MNQRNSSKVNLVRSFNRPQVVIPGIGKPDPVGPIKENARKILERKKAQRMIIKKTIESEIDCLKRLRRELAEAIDRYETQVIRVSNLSNKSNVVWTDEHIYRREASDLVTAVHKADDKLGVPHEF